MVDRIPSKRGRDGKKRGRRGGFRLNAGRRFGSVNEAKRVARAQAARVTSLPHELLFEWASTGQMKFKDRFVELEPSDRIACAKGCAAWYRAPYQAKQAPGDQPPVMQLVLDPKMVDALARRSPDKAEVLRDVLRAIAAGGGNLPAAQDETTGDADPSRYGRMLTETSKTEGRA